MSLDGVLQAPRIRGELGGDAGDKQEIPGNGFYAVCMDSEGNPSGLYQDASGQ